MSVRVTDNSREVIAQRGFYKNSVGSSTPEQVIEELIAASEKARTLDCRSGSGNWYELPEELPENDELDKRAEAIAEKWLEDKVNIERAAKHVRRPVPPVEKPLLRASKFCQFQATSDQSSWSLHGHPGIDQETQVMVFIALEDLGPHNGFPFELKRCQDVCVDGCAKLLTPPTGGGRAVCFSLDM